MAVENDLVIIYYEDNPLTFARIESILPDAKKNWYHVTLLLLQVPLQTVTWILRDIYINGQEFTMNDKKMRLEKVIPPDTDVKQQSTEKIPSAPKQTGSANIISLNNRKKK